MRVGNNMAKIHKTKKYIRVRLKTPSKKRYIRYRTIKLGKGLKGVIGVKRTIGKKKGRTELQAVLIPKSLDMQKAKQYKKKKRK